MQEDYRHWLRSCSICQRFGPSYVHVKLNPLVIDHPSQVVAIDFIGPLAVDENNNKFIFSMVGTHTRYAELIVVDKQDAFKVVECVKCVWV